MPYALMAFVSAIVILIAKYVSSGKVHKMKQKTAIADRELRRMKVQLKAAENRHSVTTLELKKEQGNTVRSANQLRKYDEELAQFRKKKP